MWGGCLCTPVHLPCCNAVYLILCSHPVQVLGAGVLPGCAMKVMPVNMQHRHSKMPCLPAPNLQWSR